MQNSPLVLAALCVLAPFVGSFLGTLIVRLPQHRPMVFARSICEQCGHALGPLDLVPLFSWLWLGAKCRYCRAAVDAFYPLVELAALAVVLWAATETEGVVLGASCVLGWALLAVAIVDWRHFLVPNALSLFVTASGIAFAAYLDPATLLDRAIGIAAGFAVLAGVAWLYRSLRGREGLGLGDAKLFAGLGAWVSWQGLPSVLILGSILAVCFVLTRSLAGHKLSAADRVPFATFLAPAGWIVWLYGPLVAA